MNLSGRVADIILAQLAEWGVKRIYGVLGDAIFPLLDAVSRQDKIQFVTAAHDGNAAFMASYEARVTGRLAVCAATSGPGAVCLLNGLADAYTDGSPVLAITGQVETKKMGPGTKQFFDQQGLFSSLTGHTSLLIDPESTVDQLVRAARKASLKSTAVHLSVPRDVLSARASVDSAPSGAVEVKKIPCIIGSVESALTALRSARRPLVVLGHEAKSVREQALGVAGKLGAGLTTAQGAKGLVEGGHDLNIGGIGEAFVPSLAGEADCIVVIGSAPYERPFFPKGAAMVHIHRCPEKIHTGASHSLAGDLRMILEDLLKGLEGHAVNEGWLAGVREESRRRRQEIADQAGKGEVPVHPLGLMAALSEVMPGDAIIALDIGEFIHWFDRGFLEDRQEIVVSGMWRSTGCGLPAAIGAKFACPERIVVALVGDGGLIMSMNEMLTCVRHNLAITVIVVRNNLYSIEKNKMEAQGFNPFGTRLLTPDFVQLARSCGAEGFRAKDPAGIREAVRAALGLGKPALVEVSCAFVDLPSAGKH